MDVSLVSVLRLLIDTSTWLPYDNFKWGMLNGKGSALRWVLGDEWDFLDA